MMVRTRSRLPADAANPGAGLGRHRAMIRAGYPVSPTSSLFIAYGRAGAAGVVVAGGAGAGVPPFRTTVNGPI